MTAPREGHRPHGRRIRCAGGYFAFVPAPLPPPIVWDGALTAALSRADFAIGRLAGEGRRFTDPHLFIRSFVRREAVLSSRIEGTRTTLAELLAAEAGGTGATDAADLREVGNYVAALEYGLERVETLPVSLRLIRELHERLMRGVRGDAAGSRRVPAQPELDRAAGMRIERCQLRAAAGRRIGGMSLRPGKISSRERLAAAGADGARARAVRGDSSVCRRQRPGRAPADYAPVDRTRPVTVPASLSERVFRSHEGSLLCASARRDRG